MEKALINLRKAENDDIDTLSRKLNKNFLNLYQSAPRPQHLLPLSTFNVVKVKLTLNTLSARSHERY